MAHTKFTLAERVVIGILLTKKFSLRSIAKQLGKGHNSVAYEVKVHTVNGVYNAKKAHAKARVRLKCGRRGWMKIEKDPALKRLVIAGLMNHWNPDEIAGFLKKRVDRMHLRQLSMTGYVRVEVSGTVYICTHKERSFEDAYRNQQRS